MNVIDYRNNTPFHAAAREGHKGIVKALFAAAADLLAKIKKGEMAFDFAKNDDTKSLLK